LLTVEVARRIQDPAMKIESPSVIPRVDSDGGPLGKTRFSIIMPSYNSGTFIERSILSVLDQDWPNLELIVIDGSSSDETVGILERYSSRLHYWESVTDSGQSDALNQGFARATGDIYGWLNADDLYLPGAFARVAAAFDDPRTQLVYGDWLSIDPSDAELFRHIALPPSLTRLVADGFQFNLQATFWRAELHAAAGPFDLALHRTMDYDFAVGLLQSTRRSEIVVIPEPLGAFRRHPEQKTQAFDAEVAAEQRAIAAKRGIAWKYTWRATPPRLQSKLVKALTWLRRGAWHEFARFLARTPYRGT
jgi:glycosyltransferase involved in cell wall biosynthesis